MFWGEILSPSASPAERQQDEEIEIANLDKEARKGLPVAWVVTRDEPMAVELASFVLDVEG